MEVTYDDGRAVVEALGGLHSLTGLAARWGMSKQRASVLAQSPTFPDPVRAGGLELYFGTEADEWLERRRAA